MGYREPTGSAPSIARSGRPSRVAIRAFAQRSHSARRQVYCWPRLDLFGQVPRAHELNANREREARRSRAQERVLSGSYVVEQHEAGCLQRYIDDIPRPDLKLGKDHRLLSESKNEREGC